MSTDSPFVGESRDIFQLFEFSEGFLVVPGPDSNRRALWWGI